MTKPQTNKKKQRKRQANGTMDKQADTCVRQTDREIRRYGEKKAGPSWDLNLQPLFIRPLSYSSDRQTDRHRDVNRGNSLEMVVNDMFGGKKVDSTGLEPASLGFAPIALPIELRAQLESLGCQSDRQTDR